MNKKRNILLIAFAALVAAPLVYAASVHFKGGAPSFTDNGKTLTTCFSLAGLGNQDVTITVKTTGSATTICRNQGGNAAPGFRLDGLGLQDSRLQAVRRQRRLKPEAFVT